MGAAATVAVAAGEAAERAHAPVGPGCSLHSSSGGAFGNSAAEGVPADREGEFAFVLSSVVAEKTVSPLTAAVEAEAAGAPRAELNPSGSSCSSSEGAVEESSEDEGDDCGSLTEKRGGVEDEAAADAEAAETAGLELAATEVAAAPAFLLAAADAADAVAGLLPALFDLSSSSPTTSLPAARPVGLAFGDAEGRSFGVAGAETFGVRERDEAAEVAADPAAAVAAEPVDVRGVFALAAEGGENNRRAAEFGAELGVDAACASDGGDNGSPPALLRAAAFDAAEEEEEGEDVRLDAEAWRAKAGLRPDAERAV